MFYRKNGRYTGGSVMILMLNCSYKEKDGNTQVFYLKNAVATFSSFGGEPEVVCF